MGGRRVSKCADGWAVAVVPRLDGLVSRAEHGVASHKREPASRGRAGGVGGVGVGEMADDRPQRDAGCFGRHLSDRQVDALSNVGRAMKEGGAGWGLVVGLAMEVDLGLTAFGKAERETDVLVASGKATATTNSVRFGWKARHWSERGAVVEG